MLATRHPARVERLVYLDAAFDYRAILDSPEGASGRLQTPQPPIPAYDDNTVRTWTLYGERVSGPGFPEAEARAMFPYWATLDSTARTRAAAGFNAVTTLHERLGAQFREAVPHARVVDIPGARHYVFLTHPGEVEHAMLEFLLPPARRR